MSDWRDKIKKARLPETVVPIIMRGDLAAEHELLLAELEKARARRKTSLAGDPSVAPLEERLQEVEAEIRESIVEFRLRALPRSRRQGDNRPSFRELQTEHPVREVNGEIVREDMMAGWVNAITFPEPLVRACVIDPEMSAGDWEDFFGEISDGQFDALYTAAYTINRAKVDVPFSSAGSATTPATVSE